MHSNRTSKLPPGHILTERAKTSGMPDVVSGSSITVDPLDLIIFLVPSRVQMTLTKFVDVKSIPSIMGRCMCLQTIRLCEWLIIDCESAGDLTKSAHVFSGGILNERLVPCVQVLT